MINEEQIKEWREQANTLHNEVQIIVDSEWDSICEKSRVSQTPMKYMPLSIRNNIRLLRRVLLDLEEVVEHFDNVENV